MIIEIPDNNSIIRWKKNDKDEWQSAEISDLINAYKERPKGEWIPVNPDCRGYPEYFKCSICRAHIYTSGAEKELDYNGCPYCFTDMRGDAEINRWLDKEDKNE